MSIARWIVLAATVGSAGCLRANPAFDGLGGSGEPEDHGGSTGGTTDPLEPTGQQTAEADDTDPGGTSGAGPGSGDDPADSSDSTGSPPHSESSSGGVEMPVSMAGDWFLCEYGTDGMVPHDDCDTIDNDGVRFDPNGDVFVLRFENEPADHCVDGGRCLPWDEPDPGELTVTPWGHWSSEAVEGGLRMNVSSPECTGASSWHLDPGEPFGIAKPLEHEGCQLIGFGSPGILEQGPWYVRRRPR